MGTGGRRELVQHDRLLPERPVRRTSVSSSWDRAHPDASDAGRHRGYVPGPARRWTGYRTRSTDGHALVPNSALAVRPGQDLVVAENSGRSLAADYDRDPDRFAANQAATAAYSRAGDVHGPVARRLASTGVDAVLDLGGGTGTLARALASEGLQAVVLDTAEHIVQAPRPAVRADLRALPFRSASFPAAACLWVLYHLDEPREALREAARVLEPGGWFVTCTSARDNDPELAAVLPGWGSPGTFDAEDAAGIVQAEFDEVEVEYWDAPMIRLPDRGALALFLRGRGLTEVEARRAATRFTTPMEVTKRGCLVWARRRATGAGG